MPKRLSDVRPDATVTLWGPMKDPYVGLRVSNIIQLSAQVDHELSLLLVRILGTSARVAHAMFDALRSAHLKTQVLTAAANVELARFPEKHRIFRAILKVADMAQEDRNKIAHWVWGHSPQLPNALLLADPIFVRTQHIEQARAVDDVSDTLIKLFAIRSASESDDEFGKIWEINKDQVQVYELEDLDHAVEKLAEATNALFYFRFVMRPLQLNQLADKGAPPPDSLATDLGTVDGALRRLETLRLFREALARVDGSKGRDSTPESHS